MWLERAGFVLRGLWASVWFMPDHSCFVEVGNVEEGIQ